MSVQEQIMGLLKEIKQDVVIDDVEANLFENGVLDSLGMAFLVPALEEKFSLEIDIDDIEPENFISVAAMSKFLAERYGVE